MQAVLCALNAKYVHTNPAVQYIKAYADKHAEGVSCHIVEETIHTAADVVIERIYAYHPQVVAFSCYIWNIEQVLLVAERIRLEKPEITIVLGGPEVSYNPERYLARNDVDYVQRGEGEKPMTALFSALARHAAIPQGFGICYRENGENVIDAIYTELDLNSLESPYTEEYCKAVSGRLAYFEASRGCPFSCAFCLSGGCRGVRYFDMEYVKCNLLLLWNSGVRTVKFVDRTFNADRKRADEIISFVLERAPHMPKVCFHFEVAADILADSTLELLSKAPEGLFQIEAGIQSFNEITLATVTRKNSLDKVCRNVKKVLEFQNIHTHIDLIAGLPYEGLESFRESFNRAFAIGAHMLQLGFLKLLYGSRLRDEMEEHGFICAPTAPYTVKSTKWLTEQEMERIHDAEDANEKIYNSHRFESSLAYVLAVSGMAPFDLFEGFGMQASMPLDAYTNKVFDYFSSLPGVDQMVLRDKMCKDRMKTNNSGKLPDSLKIKDERLGDIAHFLDKSRPKGVKRAVCILYSENQVAYADYIKDENLPYDIQYLNLERTLKQAEADKRGI